MDRFGGFSLSLCLRVLPPPPRIYSAMYAGGSLAAAQALIAGDDIAINLMGGQTHARRDCASGFSYVNDVVLSILHLLRAPPASLEAESSGGETRRVLYLNLDAWHSSGVEEAFFTTDRVFTLSLHRCARRPLATSSAHKKPPSAHPLPPAYPASVARGRRRDASATLSVDC